MDEIYVIISAFAFGFLGCILGVYCAIWYIRKEGIIEEILSNSIISISQDEDTLKALYQVGGIVGSGIKGGVGLDLPTKQRSGKFKWQDLLLEFASQFISQSIKLPSPSPASPIPNPSQDIKATNLSDKW